MTAGAARDAHTQADRLLAFALAQPHAAFARAKAWTLADTAGSDAFRMSVAHQTMGIVRRDEGDHPSALRHFAAARRWARQSDDANRLADIEASEGVALVQSGRTRAGLARLEQAARRAHGVTGAKVGYRRAAILIQLGRYDQARTGLQTVARELRGADEPLWLARTHLARSWVDLATGRVNDAQTLARTAHRMFLEHGQTFEAAIATENLGRILAATGHIPRALAVLDEAEAAFAAVGEVPTELAVDRCATLLLARLVQEAGALAQRLADEHSTPAHVRAEMELLAAECAFEQGATDLAEQRARTAGRMFRSQRRQDWQWRAVLVGVQARLSAGRSAPADRARIEAVVAGLDAASSPSVRLARLVAADVYAARGDRAGADRHLATAARRQRSAPAFDRALAATARARRAEHSARPGSVLAACREGLAALAEQRSYCADPELRALATDHARQLTDLALWAALATGRPRTLLHWSERTRAVTLQPPPVRPPTDPRVGASLAAAREAVRRIAEANDPAVAAYLNRQREQHEQAARQVARHSFAAGRSVRRPDEVGDLVEAIADGALVALVEVSGTLHVLLVHRRRVRRFEVGPMAIALREADFARFALRRAAFGGRPVPDRVAARLQEAILGPLADRLPERVVVVPPAPLHAVPWSLLPALTTRTISVAPSAGSWVRASRATRSADGPVVLVTGPGLTTLASEATDVARAYPQATVLGPQQATVARTLAALTGARLAHLAAHGAFRGDAPMFSELRLADGPLYLHDLDSLRQPPGTLILSACDLGDTAALGVDEGLGMVTGLLGMGTAQVLASVVPVNDEATVAVMRTIHRQLAAGAGLAAAARVSRDSHRDEPDRYAAATAFTAWGA